MAEISNCCVKGFNWSGIPEGREERFADHDVYITGSNTEAAVLIVHDLFGWRFNNLRLLADHYAREADVCVHMPDFFYGGGLDNRLLADEKMEQLDIPGLIAHHNKTTRRDAIFACARALRSQYKKVGAVGYCFGGWAVFQLGPRANIFEDVSLVDYVSTAHPGLLEEAGIDDVGVPVQICAPEHGPAFTPKLKEYANKVIPTLGVSYDYQYFPGGVHAFATRGDPINDKGMRAMRRAKDAAVSWCRLWLHD